MSELTERQPPWRECLADFTRIEPVDPAFIGACEAWADLHTRHLVTDPSLGRFDPARVEAHLRQVDVLVARALAQPDDARARVPVQWFAEQVLRALAPDSARRPADPPNARREDPSNARLDPAAD